MRTLFIMTGTVILIILSICIGTYAEGITIKPVSNRSGSSWKITETPMHKAVLTQRGYIQFLRWQLAVPEINEFTFCVWVKSMNLTYPHAIFSYSKNEKNRLVRAWIAPFGRSIHLEINNVKIFSVPTFIRENQWYHICQSWDNKDGNHGLWIDGQNKLDNTVPNMAGYVIPSNGDIVLGQEYTDFDEGLEEGIEGSVLGFNLLLASAFNNYTEFGPNNSDLASNAPIDFPKFRSMNPKRQSINSNNPDATRNARTSLELEQIDRARLTLETGKRAERISERIWKRIPNRERLIGQLLGLRLIETGYYHCEVGRGSPHVGGDKLLISWSRTPVKVYGGAILKNVDNQCGVFNP